MEIGEDVHHGLTLLAVLKATGPHRRPDGDVEVTRARAPPSSHKGGRGRPGRSCLPPTGRRDRGGPGPPRPEAGVKTGSGTSRKRVPAGSMTSSRRAVLRRRQPAGAEHLGRHDQREPGLAAWASSTVTPGQRADAACPGRLEVEDPEVGDRATKDLVEAGRGQAVARPVHRCRAPRRPGRRGPWGPWRTSSSHVVDRVAGRPARRAGPDGRLLGVGRGRRCSGCRTGRPGSPSSRGGGRFPDHVERMRRYGL